MNEMDLKRKEQEGKRAKQLLDDELIKKAFHDIRENIYDKIGSSSFSQSEEREECYRMLRTLMSFEGQFQKYIQTGRLAEKKLSEKVKDYIKRVQEL